MAAGKARRDIEAEITDRIVAALERGTVPWARPWNASGMMPTSASSGKPYRGINVWLLSLTAMDKGYTSPYWLTFKQAQAFGGSVRKGEKSTLAVFWKMLDVERENAAGDKVTGKVPMLRHYNLFNVEQCDDVKLPPRFQPDPDAEPIDPSTAVDGIIAGYTDGPAITNVAQDGAFYTPSADRITLPPVAAFPTVPGYAATLFHELTHSTGHASRLNRFERTGEPQHFGSERYAHEELLAEMGSAYLLAIAGIDSPERTENTAAYIASWLGALRDDTSLVIRAAQAAQKAVDRIVGTTFETTDATPGGEAA